MGLPTAYLTSTKNVAGILTAIQAAQAPKQFTASFLQGLDFKSSADRLMIGMLKALGLLDANGAPTQRYFEFLDQSQGGRVLAEALREAYSDLYELNRNAHELTTQDIKGKMKTRTQGQFSDSVLSKMAATFKAFAAQADFTAVTPAEPPTREEVEPQEVIEGEEEEKRLPGRRLNLGGLVYTIQIQLPESRDPAVYDALFRSLKTHLFNE